MTTKVRVILELELAEKYAVETETRFEEMREDICHMFTMPEDVVDDIQVIEELPNKETPAEDKPTTEPEEPDVDTILKDMTSACGPDVDMIKNMIADSTTWGKRLASTQESYHKTLSELNQIIQEVSGQHDQLCDKLVDIDKIHPELECLEGFGELTDNLRILREESAAEPEPSAEPAEEDQPAEDEPSQESSQDHSQESVAESIDEDLPLPSYKELIDPDVDTEVDRVTWNHLIHVYTLDRLHSQFYSQKHRFTTDYRWFWVKLTTFVMETWEMDMNHSRRCAQEVVEMAWPGLAERLLQNAYAEDKSQ
eukprot:SAG11_NODE_7133_length_1188_cov_20.225895_1_plen_310_part_00